MSLTVPPEPAEQTAGDSGSVRRRLFLGLSVSRFVLAIVAIPLAPALYRDHPAVLVLLRPTKEVLLFAGFQVERGAVSPVVAVLAALPLLLPGVWVTFGLGRAYADDLADDDDEGGGLGGLVGRVIPAKKVRAMQELLDDHGLWVVFLGRLAQFPSTLLAAAAGAAGIGWRRFLLADIAGAALSLTIVLGLGVLLGDAHDAAGPWVTVGGVIVLLGLAGAMGWWLKRRGHKSRSRQAGG